MFPTKLLGVSSFMLSALLLVGAGCMPATDTTTNTTTDTTVVKPVSETNQYKYENLTYGFSLVFPESWGTVEENIENGEKITSIKLSAENDPARYISIQVVKIEDKNDPAVIDYPQKPLTENAIYSYYYTADTEDYTGNTELQAINKSFTLTEATFEPLSYSTTDGPVSVLKEKATFDLTADQLQGNADECGTEYEADHFVQLVAQFNSSTMLKYDFKYTAPSQAADTFKVTVMPNNAGYTSLEQFKNDWDICAAGGSLYPIMFNTDWLLFENSCGSGFDDGSGLPVGCDEVRKVVEPSLELNTIE